MHHIEIVSQLAGPHLEQLPELLEAATSADGHEPVGEHKFLRLTRGDDLAVAVLAYEDGRLVGYGHNVAYGADAERRASCEFVVHPEFRRRGVGRMLLSHGIMHATGADARRLDVWAYNHSPASARLARCFGFAPSRRLLHLHRHVGAATPRQRPVCASVRPFRPGADEATWLALNNRIFAGHPEQGAWTMEDLEARMAQPWFDPDDVLMLELGGEPAGFCWLKVDERGEDGRVGEVYIIGTAPEHRGSGVGRWLLDEGLRRLEARDVAVAAVYVDESNGRALRVYEDAGFHHHHVDVCYSRDLAARELPVPQEVAAA